jgi:hypothetical protein
VSAEDHTVLLEYRDSDGDDLRIVLDPLDGDTENVLIYAHCNEPGHMRRVAVRVPLSVLLAAVQQVQQVQP